MFTAGVAKQRGSGSEPTAENAGAGSSDADRNPSGRVLKMRAAGHLETEHGQPFLRFIQQGYSIDCAF